MIVEQKIKEQEVIQRFLFLCAFVASWRITIFKE